MYVSNTNSKRLWKLVGFQSLFCIPKHKIFQGKQRFVVNLVGKNNQIAEFSPKITQLM